MFHNWFKAIDLNKGEFMEMNPIKGAMLLPSKKKEILLENHPDKVNRGKGESDEAFKER